MGVGEDGEAPPPGADVPARTGGGPPPGDGYEVLFTFRARVIAGVIFFVLYLVTFALRGLVLPGIVGGALGGLVVFLVFKEVEARRRRRLRG